MGSISGETYMTATFPIKTLPKCYNTTNYIELNVLCKVVYHNWASIASSLNSMYGHLGAVMPDITYVAQIGDHHNFIVQDPGPYNTTLACNEANAKRSQAKAKHTS